jgi:hypothetical protein
VKLERPNGGHGGGHGTNRLVHEAIAAARTARAIIPSIFSTQSIPHNFSLDESSLENSLKAAESGKIVLGAA